MAGLSVNVEASSLLLGARWIQDIMLGTIATTIAVIAVAGFGYLLLTGRVDLRRGATIILGCFFLFGAPLIASGLYGLATLDGSADAYQEGPEMPAPSSTLPIYDPHAGASVPKTR